MTGLKSNQITSKVHHGLGLAQACKILSDINLSCNFKYLPLIQAVQSNYNYHNWKEKLLRCIEEEKFAKTYISHHCGQKILQN